MVMVFLQNNSTLFSVLFHGFKSLLLIPSGPEMVWRLAKELSWPKEGEIWVESEQNKGSTLYKRFPKPQ